MTERTKDPHEMIPIWFLIGVTILTYGVIIAVVGVINWTHPAPHVAMTYLHADFWWGLFMIVIGLFYSIRFRPWRRQADQSADDSR